MKLCFVAGGSGGHITPALGVADYLRKYHADAEVFFVTSGNELEHEIFSQHGYHYRQEVISTGKFRRYFSLQNIFDLWKIPRGILQSYQILKTEKPDVIFSKGGYVALPVGIAAKILKIPFVIHESDTVPGLANRVLHHAATRILTTFPQERGECVGTPVRPEILRGNAEKGRQFLGFPESEKIILVMGGSQGAEAINQLLLHSIDVLMKKACIVHLAGKGKVVAQDSARYKSFGYLGKEYPDVLAAADTVVSRAGANSLFEFAVAQKPVILIPLPSAANNHQWKNALYFAQKKAAMVLDQEEMTSNMFQAKVLQFLEDDKGRSDISKNIGTLAQKSALERIGEILMQFQRK